MLASVPKAMVAAGTIGAAEGAEAVTVMAAGPSVTNATGMIIKL